MLTRGRCINLCLILWCQGTTMTTLEVQEAAAVAAVLGQHPSQGMAQLAQESGLVLRLLAVARNPHHLGDLLARQKQARLLGALAPPPTVQICTTVFGAKLRSGTSRRLEHNGRLAQRPPVYAQHLLCFDFGFPHRFLSLTRTPPSYPSHPNRGRHKF